MYELLLWYSGSYASLPHRWVFRFHMPRLRLRRRVVIVPLLLVLLAAMPLSAAAQRSYSESSTRYALLSLYDHWEGAPYRYGGNSRYGVDCSGFVHIAFRDALGIEVPRSTELLSRSGYRISRSNLIAGDILVFRTSRSNLHVGIYVGRGQFIHASKSEGVILSDLSNPYWQDTYLKSVRVIDQRI